MKISNLGVANTPHPSQLQVEETTAGGGDQPAPSVAAGAQGYTPSSELQQLLQLVRQQPQVREDRIQAALQRLQQGHYQTQASAEKTAAALLQGLN